MRLDEKEVEEFKNDNGGVGKEDCQNNNNNFKKSKELARNLDDVDAPGISAEEKGRRAWSQYLRRDNSFITDLFLGLFRSTLK